MSDDIHILDALKLLISKESGNDFIGAFVSNESKDQHGYYLLFFGRANLCGSLSDYALSCKTEYGIERFDAITNVFSDSEFTRFELLDYLFDDMHSGFNAEVKKDIQDFFYSHTKKKGTREFEILNGAFLALDHSEMLFLDSLAYDVPRKLTYH